MFRVFDLYETPSKWITSIMKSSHIIRLLWINSFSLQNGNY